MSFFISKISNLKFLISNGGGLLRKLFNFKRKIEGFTLVEMLVVLGVTAMLSSIFVVQSSMLRDQVALFKEEARLIQNIYRAKTDSIQVLAADNGEAACGYGIYITDRGLADGASAKYDLYYNEKSGDCPETVSHDSSSKIKGSSYILDSRVKIRSDSVVDITFKPPYPEVFIDGGKGDGVIYLCLKSQEDFCRGVRVNLVGQITSVKN